MIENVGQLRELLAALPADAPIVATWEGICREIAVYSAPNGFVLIDADYERYREDFESGSLQPYRDS